MPTVDEQLSSPFDAIAESYDQEFTASKIGQAQRASVWCELEKTFGPGQKILELGCGTGVDACFLAERGIRVVACDNSFRMVQVAKQRICCLPDSHANFVQLRLLAAEDIASLRDEGPFDGVFSNFGVLNCVEDLEFLARSLAALLKPGSTALLCLMGRCCMWEMAWYSLRGEWGKAFRRFRTRGVQARLAEGATVKVHYPAIRSLAEMFAADFLLRSIKGVGVVVPPTYVAPWINPFPRTLGAAIRVDSMVAKFPGIRGLADHVLLTFERRYS